MAEKINSVLGGSVGTREDQVVLSRDVALDVPTLQAAWPEFESAFDSLQNRRMMGLIFNQDNVYLLATSQLERDADIRCGLAESVVPGGDYLRLRLVGEPPAIYASIAAAFDTLFEHADHDPGRPLIEFYRREGEIDCMALVR